MPLSKIEQRERDFIEFAAGFKRSRRVNLWAHVEGFIVTVFERDGRWAFCLSDENGPTFESGYETEEDAILGAFQWFTL